MREKREHLMVPNSTQVPNVLFDVVMRACSPGVFKVVACICRQTYGWQKRWEAISISTVVVMTGLSNRFVIDALDLLTKSTITKRGAKTEYGFEYCMNESPDLERALEVLKVDERKPREKRSGGRKKGVKASEPSSLGPMNQVHEGSELSADAASSQEPMNPVPQLVNQVHTSKPTVLKPTIQTKEERPLSENVRAIVQSKFFGELESLPVRTDFDPDKDRMCRIRIAALKSGFGLANAKEALRIHPDWWTWPYLDLIDSQAEIEFPAPPAPRSEPFWNSFTVDKVATAIEIAEQVIAERQAKKNSEGNLRRLGRALGTMAAGDIDDFIQYVKSGLKERQATA